MEFGNSGVLQPLCESDPQDGCPASNPILGPLRFSCPHRLWGEPLHFSVPSSFHKAGWVSLCPDD